MGFTDRLRLLSIVVNDFVVETDFSAVKGCKEVAFSNSGHMFAAAVGTNILVYSTYTFQNISYITKGCLIDITERYDWLISYRTYRNGNEHELVQ